MSAGATGEDLGARLQRGTPVAIALDLGGTDTKGGLVGPGGAAAHLQRRPTRVEGGYGRVLDDLAAFVAELTSQAAEAGLPVVGIGIGAPGPLDRASGVIQFAPNLGWTDVPLAVDLAARTRVARVRLENDANAAAFAEAWVGGGAGARCMLGVTLGTGVGAGVVIGGRLFSGATGLASELGHVVVRPEGRPCRCGRRGCVEAHFSGWALVQAYREHAGARDPGAVRARDLSAEDVLEAWARGDPHARHVLEDGLGVFALGLAAAVNLLNPDRVVFLGGLAESWPLFGPALVARLQPLLLAATAEAVRFTPSRLRWAGVLGAGGLLLDTSPEL